MKLHLNGFLETSEPMSRLAIAEDGTVTKRGRVAVHERDLDFELTGMHLEEDGSRSAWFRWLPLEEIVQPTGFLARHPRIAKLIGASAVTA